MHLEQPIPSNNNYLKKPTNKNPSWIYKLKCNTCNNVYVGQSGWSINVRHKEHKRYVRTNTPLSAYALHILQIDMNVEQ